MSARSVYTAGMPTARRRRRRAVRLSLAGVAVLALLVMGTLWLAGLGESGESETRVVAGTCPDPPAGIVVDVYNATDRVGIAGIAADGLRAQGFTVGETTDAPDGTVVLGTAEIRHGPDAREGAAALAHRIRGAAVIDIPRDGDSVDLVIGEEFGAVTSPTAPTTC